MKRTWYNAVIQSVMGQWSHLRERSVIPFFSFRHPYKHQFTGQRRKTGMHIKISK